MARARKKREAAAVDKTSNDFYLKHSELDREERYISLRRYDRLKAAGDSLGHSFEKGSDEGKEYKGWTKLVVNFDTGAAITAVPKSLDEQGLFEGDGQFHVLQDCLRGTS